MKVLYQNNRIRIRPYQPEDREGMFNCVTHSTAEMQPYLPWVHEAYSLAETDTWISWAHFNWQTGRQYDFVIEDRSTGMFLGGIGLLEVDLIQKTAKLGYWLRTDYTGKGITTDAAKLIKKFAKKQLGLKQLVIYMSSDNIASIKVAQKLGAKYQETKLRHEFINGRYLDCDFYLLDLSNKPLSRH